MRAIAEACLRGDLDADIHAVISPKSDSPATAWARENHLVVAVVEPGASEARRMLQVLEGVDVLCLAGFLRLLPTEVLHNFKGQILNIHPALLPKFGGKGMYGMHVHSAVLKAGETESGCTVHRVTENYDEGEIILQLRCSVLPNDTPETLAARVLQLEHNAYPEAIRKVLGG